MRIALVGTVRNEGPFLLEWIAYHRSIGFTEIWLCSNDCDDDSPALLDLLHAHGIVRHRACQPAPDEKAQLHAYARIEAQMTPDWPDWLMVLDADEFLLVHAGSGQVRDLIEAVPDATAILVNWRVFGSAGARRWSSALVTRRFTRAARRDHGVNWSFKTLFRLPHAYHCPLLPHGPGHARAEHLPLLRPVDGAGRLLPERYARSDTFLQTEPGAVRWSLAQVNHYNTRSWEDYLVKHRRGGGQGPERWERDANWSAFDRNDEEDRAIHRHLPALVEERDRLLTLSGVRAAHERCCARYAQHVDRLARAEV